MALTVYHLPRHCNLLGRGSDHECRQSAGVSHSQADCPSRKFVGGKHGQTNGRAEGARARPAEKKPQVKVAHVLGVSRGRTPSNPMNIMKNAERRSTKAME